MKCLRIVDAISGNLFFEEDLGVLGSDYMK